jgi:hypothetical protein
MQGRSPDIPDDGSPDVDDPSIDADTEYDGSGGVDGNGNQVNVVALLVYTLT